MITKDVSGQQTTPIRVYIAMMSGILFEIVTRTIQQQPDMIIKHFVKDSDELKTLVEDQTDVLILSAPYVYPPPPICHTLWRSLPLLKVLVMTPNGDTAVIYRLHVHRQRLKTVAASTLVRTIRRSQRLDLTDDWNVSAVSSEG
jgi:hypothetical protein